MNTLLWIVFGALVGWVASAITGYHPSLGILGTMFIGIVGSFLGGWISSKLFIGGPPVWGFDIRSIIFAILGSVIVIALLNIIF